MFSYSTRTALSVLIALLLMTVNSYAQTDSRKAGAVTGLLPSGKLTRGPAKAASITDLQKGELVQWNDLLTTDLGGRIRVVLNDQSILSIGSKSTLRVLQHDHTTQQTLLELTYGRVRAEVAAITNKSGLFELRTPTAVAGVIGTEFIVDVDEAGETTVTCLRGRVSVKNADPKVKGEQFVTAGQLSTIKRGKKPAPPKAAPPEHLDRVKRETEVAEKDPEPIKNAGSAQSGSRENSEESKNSKSGEGKTSTASEKDSAGKEDKAPEEAKGSTSESEHPAKGSKSTNPSPKTVKARKATPKPPAKKP